MKVTKNSYQNNFNAGFEIDLVSFIHSFIHSFIPAISIAPLQVLYHSEALPTTAKILYRSFTPKRTGIAGKGLAQGPYVTARAGVESTTLRLKVIDSTKVPSRPIGAIHKVRHARGGGVREGVTVCDMGRGSKSM